MSKKSIIESINNKKSLSDLKINDIIRVYEMCSNHSINHYKFVNKKIDESCCGYLDYIVKGEKTYSAYKDKYVIRCVCVSVHIISYICNDDKWKYLGNGIEVYNDE